MLNKIKTLGIIFMSILLLTNCNKENKQDPTQQGELVFAAIDVTPDKSVVCDPTLTVTHARVVINGETYYPLTFTLDGKLYTQSIKLNVLAPGLHYTLEEFSLMDDMGTPDRADDKIVKSTPMADSEYAQYVEFPLVRDFVIEPFRKFEMKIEVLCYTDAVYDLFGFLWYEVTEITVREQCFFGDFCIKHLPDYEGSLYDLNGLQIDEVAIFKIVGYRNGDPIGEFYNTYYDDGQNFMFKEPLCVQYADYDNSTDNFLFELWIYVKVGNDFEYVKFHSWEFMDDEMIEAGEDGVVDFVLGNCNYSNTDLLLPPYMNLPANFTYTIIQYPWTPSYFQINLNGIGPGYDIGNGNYDAWCADKNHTINVGTSYSMDAFSSLYPDLLPGGWDAPNKEAQLAACNWLFNNLNLFPPVSSDEMQNALWYIFDGVVVGGVAGDMYDAAMMHTDFSPLPGGWAAVLYFTSDRSVKQITFRIVDP